MAESPKEPSTTEPLYTPTPSELDVLSVLWSCRDPGAEEAGPMRLAEIHRGVRKRRQQRGEPQPAITTVSTQLRSLLSKGLLKEVVVDPSAEGGAVRAVRTRSFLSPATRSPNTGYVAAFSPGQVLKPIYRVLAGTYPKTDRHQALRDFAEALSEGRKGEGGPGYEPAFLKKAVKEIEKRLDEWRVK